MFTFFAEADGNGRYLAVFGGGARAENAVDDNDLYIFNTISNRWKKLLSSGTKPGARQGHVMASVGSKV
jgi:N-acetylneuraminic acid mutarotase